MKKYLLLFLLIFALGLATAAPAQNNSSRDLFDQASLQYLTGNFAAAENNLRAVLMSDPLNSEAKKLLEIILREKKITGVKGLTGKEKARLAKGYLATGNKLLAEKDFPQAVVYFSKALILTPKNKAVLKQLGAAVAALRVEAGQRGHAARQGMLAGAALTAGLAILLSLLAIFAERKYLEAAARRRANVCFNCGEKISPTIDVCPNCGAWVGSKLRVSIDREVKEWYEKIGWRKNPFTLDIHPELFTGYRDEVKNILEKVALRCGHILISGPLGAGKTTLLRWLAGYFKNDAHAIYIPRPPQEFNQLIKLIMERMGINPRRVKDYDIYHLTDLRKKMGKDLIILLDEAHEFTIDIERPLRTLGDLDGVILIMAGMLGTADKFKNEIRPLYERLVLQLALTHLSLEDMEEMVRTRVEYAGGQGTHPFTQAALEKIHEISGGNPRSVVKACDWAVTKAIRLQEEKITAEMLSELKPAPSE